MNLPARRIVRSLLLQLRSTRLLSTARKRGVLEGLEGAWPSLLPVSPALHTKPDPGLRYRFRGLREPAVVVSSLLVCSFAWPCAAGAQTSPPAMRDADASGFESRLVTRIGRTGGLTSDEAAAKARASSYDVAAKRAQSEAASALVDQSVSAYVPRVKGTASYERTSPVSIVFALPRAPSLTFAYPQDNWNLQVDVDVPLSDYVLKVARQHAAAEHSEKAAKLTQRAAELAASSNAKIQYYAWARARLEEWVAEDALDLTRSHERDAKAELEVGKASQADVLGVQADVMQHGLLVVRAKDAVVLLEDRLRTAMHDRSGAHYEIGEPLLADLPPLPAENDFNDLLAEALQTRPELGSVTETTRGLEQQAAASRADILPKLDGVGTAQYANPNPRYFPPSSVWNGTWAVGAAITWSNTDVLLGLTSGSASEARAKASAAAEASLRDGIRDEVMASWQAVHEAEAAIDSTRQSLAAAEEAYRVRRALFRNDRATSTELGDSEHALTRARLDAVNARIDLRVARVRLTHAVGRDDVGGGE